MFDKIKNKVKAKWAQYNAIKKQKKIEQHRVRQLVFYFRGLNYGPTMWQTNFMGDRVRNIHKAY